ncbi:protein-(glutamine-N5) methyltransferase [Opitutaceae bacterium TAV5]|nr:protein-(glutamine-N5) methyltransferase [Opitutaceae bacterium TAV5]
MASSRKSTDFGRKRPAAARATPQRTLGQWLDYAIARYESARLALGQIAGNAHDEALYLLLRTLHLPLDSDPSVLDQTLDAKQTAAVETALRKRIDQRIPAAYLTREAWLADQRFYVDERVIIPRSYFVEVIPTLPGLLAHDPAPAPVVRRIADVCTGSGCLAILLAQQFPLARVDAIDLSTDALDVAAINVRAHKLESRIRLHASDVFDEVPVEPYDIILSNPPYEPSAHVDRQAPEFRAEPRLAHDGGPDGLVIIRKLLRQARTKLAPHGIVVLEVGALRKAINREFASLAPEWLPTEDGSNCICLIRADKLLAG